MLPCTEKTPEQWFLAAAEWYLAGHQACVACGQRHCVFHRESNDLDEYYCYGCEFSVCHDRRIDRYFVWAPSPAAPELPPALETLRNLTVLSD